MNDYQLEEMENSQIKKAGAAKKAAILAAGGLGLTATGAFAADRIGDMADADTATDTLSEEDLISGADAGALEEPATVSAPTPAPAPAPASEPEPEPKPVEVHEPEVIAGESGIAFDTEGNVIAQYDAGTVDGDQYVVLDTDLNGLGDMIAVDINGNGHIESNEIMALDNQTYVMGEPTNVAIVGVDDGPYPDPNPLELPPLTDIDDIHNDFFDETTGEEYRQDLADNNPDYNNNNGAEFYAGTGTDEPEIGTYDVDNPYDGLAEYTPGEEFDGMADTDTPDDMSAEDAFMC